MPGVTLSLGLACLPERPEAAPVTTVALAFTGQSDAGLSVALTVAADDEGRGRVLFGDGAAAIGWYRIDERAGELRFVTHDQLISGSASTASICRGREELVVSGAHELRIHWTVLAGAPRP